MPKKLLRYLVFFMLIPSLSANVIFFRKNKLATQGELVVEVVDGDTFFIANRQPIRLYGLDAPEPENCYGQEAKNALAAFVLNKKVVLTEPLSDKTGRILALVYIDGLLINELMVREGFGLYRRQAGSETENLKLANEYARTNRLGIFSPDCYQPDPVDQKSLIKGNISASGEKNYFLPKCANYDQVIVEKFMGESYFATEKEAIRAGFSKSKTCY